MCIVISGGALKGFGMLGALQYIEELYKLSNINSFVGTSVGSIISYLICIGYSPIEIVQKCVESRIIEKLRNEFKIDNIFNKKCLLQFETILEELELYTLFRYNKTFTLKTLYTELNKELCCVTYNYSLKKMEILHHTTTPDIPCLTAIQMSSSVPFLFDEFSYDGYTYIDGGVVDNFPLRVALKLGKENLLGIVANSETSLENNKLGSLFIPIYETTKKTIKKFKKKIPIIDIETNNDMFNFNIGTTEMMDFFSVGYKYCKNAFGDE